MQDMWRKPNDMWRFTVEFFWWNFLGTREVGGSPEKDPGVFDGSMMSFFEVKMLIDSYFFGRERIR